MTTSMTVTCHFPVQSEGTQVTVLCLLLQCSAECGDGIRTRSVVCMTNHVSSLPLEGCGNNRPSETTPCNNGPCAGKVEWFAGGWTQVSQAPNLTYLLLFYWYFTFKLVFGCNKDAYHKVFLHLSRVF